MPKKKASASNASSPAKTSIVDVADDVIDGQPKKSDTRTTRKSEAGAALDTSAAEPIKDFMRNLKVEEIAKWDAPTVAQAFLTALGLPRLMQPFLDHKITGAVLLELTKTDLYDIGFPPDSHRQRRVSDKCSITIGERAYLWTMILELKKKSRRADRDREIWAVRTPEGPYSGHTPGELQRELLAFDSTDMHVPTEIHVPTEMHVLVEMHMVPNEMRVPPKCMCPLKCMYQLKYMYPLKCMRSAHWDEYHGSIAPESDTMSTQISCRDFVTTAATEYLSAIHS
eukprot:m.494474 g.494474  ORF g.494474 m.494474 type:complete len:283 (-) comp21796_c1_seq1:1888-2736(-)